MTPDVDQILRLIDALETVAGVLQRLGPSGVVLVMLSGPAIVLATMLSLNHLSQRAADRQAAAVRCENRELLEAYRKDTQDILRELGADQAQTDQYYRDNVILVQRYELLAKDLVSVITCNTRAMERLSVLVEA
ncbi:MAG: hypothetical protein AB7D57_07080, partial [Desulfovibrionaceae bacterium]